MAILVTGGTGYIGSYLVRHLLAEGRDVVVYDRYPVRERLAGLGDGVTLVEGDVLDLDAIVATMEAHAVDGVAHLAGVPGAVHVEATVAYTQVMCVGTANVFEAARRLGVQRVVNASSVAVFGFDRSDAPPATEDSPTRPTDLYGASKLWSEGLARVHNEKSGMEILSLRICASYGIGRLSRASLGAGLTTERIAAMALPEFAARGEPVTMPPDDAMFDFLYAPDTALAFWLALSRPRPEHDVFNLRAHQRPWGDVTACVRRLVPDAEIAVAEQPSGALRLALMDNARLVRELVFEPRWSLEAGLEDYIERVRAARARTTSCGSGC
jgi:nucleoside-diphosphate-sugar epimerase